MSAEHGLHVMLSYHWDNKELVSNVYKGLKSRNIPVWMDIHGGISFNLFRSMADGVESAAVICCFMTPKYQNSRNCEKELLYGERRRVSIIPCRLTRNWEPSAWLGLVTAGLVWIDFRETVGVNLDLKIDRLVDQIRIVAGKDLKCFSEDFIKSQQIYRILSPRAYNQDRNRYIIKNHQTPPPVPPRPRKDLIQQRLLHINDNSVEQIRHEMITEQQNHHRSTSDTTKFSHFTIQNDNKRHGITIDYSKFRRPPRIIGDNNDEISFCCPSGVTVSKTGLIYVADQHNQCVQMLSILGNNKHVLTRPFNRPKGIHIDELGRVLVTEHNRLLILDSELNLLKTIGDHGSKPGEFNVPWGVTTDSSCNIYICDQMNNRIQKFDVDGQFILEWGYEGYQSGQFYFPHFISISNNRVAVSDQLNHRIQVFDCLGNYHYTLGEIGSEPGQFSCPFGICIDENHHLIVADHDNNRIQFFNSDGDVQLILDKDTNPLFDVQGVHGLALTHDGGLLITDYKRNGKHRLFIFA